LVIGKILDLDYFEKYRTPDDWGFWVLDFLAKVA
jgi:hypothetical protein